jgi:hypothetical protein
MSANSSNSNCAARAVATVRPSGQAARDRPDHLSHLLAWAIEDRLDANAPLDRPYHHPTFEEGLKPALREICEKVGIAPPSVRDQAAAPGA